MRHPDFTSLMGMFEMEQCVEEMLSRCKPVSTFSNSRFSPADFKGDSLVGFCHLIFGGWLKAGYPNSEFVVTQALVERLRSRESWKELPDAQEWYGFGISMRK